MHALGCPAGLDRRGRGPDMPRANRGTLTLRRPNDAADLSPDESRRELAAILLAVRTAPGSSATDGTKLVTYETAR
jgi:hypothetical protein